MSKHIVVMPGDHIGPEVIEQATAVMEVAASKAGLDLKFSEADIGGGAYEKHGTPLPDASLALARNADAVLLGAVGGPEWDNIDFKHRPERGLLRLRAELDLFANLRPAAIYGDLVDASTLKRSVVEGTDLMVIRELTGGIYFGEPRGEMTSRRGPAVGNTMIYTEAEVERIVRVGFDIARKRRGKLCSVDKANVLEVSVMWRKVAERVHQENQDVSLEHMYVDNAAMQLIRDPRQFDTIVTGNLFGDILSDAAAMLTGSIGMLPSASIGEQYALYEPVHGSAPDIAGQDKANPLATILSVGMLFRYTLDLAAVDALIQEAVTTVLAEHRTPDIHTEGKHRVGCKEMGRLVREHLEQAPPIPVPAQ